MVMQSRVVGMITETGRQGLFLSLWIGRVDVNMRWLQGLDVQPADVCHRLGLSFSLEISMIGQHCRSCQKQADVDCHAVTYPTVHRAIQF